MYDNGVPEGIAQRAPQRGYRGVQVSIEVYVRCRGPNPLLKLLPTDDLASTLDQERKDLKRPFVNFYLQTLPSKFPFAEIDFELSEADTSRRFQFAEHLI